MAIRATVAVVVCCLAEWIALHVWQRPTRSWTRCRTLPLMTRLSSWTAPSTSRRTLYTNRALTAAWKSPPGSVLLPCHIVARMSVSVSLSVTSWLSMKTTGWSTWSFSDELPLTCPTLCYNEIPVSAEVRVLYLTKVLAQSVINWNLDSQLSWQYMMASVYNLSVIAHLCLQLVGIVGSYAPADTCLGHCVLCLLSS